MRIRKKYFFIFFFIFLLSPPKGSCQNTASVSSSSEGKFIFNPGFFFRVDTRRLSSMSTTKILYGDLNFGYQYASGWYIGMLYSTENEQVVSENFPSTGIDTKYNYLRSSLGLSGGYIYGSYYARFHVLTLARWDIDENTHKAVYLGGWGGQIDLGLNFELFPNFLLGPKITYKYIIYPKYSDSSGESSLSPPLSKVSLNPYFTIWWEF
ncbi:MAG: hypothetical protein D6797_08890 [Bdellovibrio sp.]|nr:MAG: hypothetical protein D6797_08890 [Bdellovibrio sp.]